MIDTPRLFVLLVAAAALTVLASNAPAGAQDAAPNFDAMFWQHWSDGKAELAAYDLTYPRYGELRSGTAVTIFVKEDFSNSVRVKADPGRHPADDAFRVMKLNLVQDFPTGVYDYNMMTSAFVALEPVNGRPAGTPTKVSFSAQEWCGHVYQQHLFDSVGIREIAHSYFDGEADRADTLEYPRNGVAEDALLLWARGMAAPVLQPGEHVELPLLQSLERTRLKHRPTDWSPASFSRSAETRTITVPAGEFVVDVFSVAADGGRTLTFYVERAAPHRIVQWESSEGHSAKLLKSVRQSYWRMNGPGFERAVEKLGLTPRPARTP